MDGPPVRQRRDGAAAAFAAAADPHRIAMRRLAVGTAPHCDPDDVVQEAMIRAWAKLSLFDPARGDLRTWLMAITADLARRAARRATRYQLANPDPTVPAPTTGHLDIDTSLDLRRAIGKLAYRQRAALVLHYYVDLPLADIAGLLNCSLGTVKSNLSDARANLAKSLEGKKVQP